MRDAAGAPPLSHRIDGQGPRLVLLHPVGLDIASWDAVAGDLARDFTVLRVDQRGHGASPDPEQAMSLADYADETHALMAALGFVPAAVVGLSFGGMLAQTLALRHPGSVSALIASGCPATLPPEGRLALAERGALAEREGMAAVVEATLTRWFTPEFIVAGGAEATRARLLSDRVAGWATAWRAIADLNTLPDLPRIACPTLCIAGDKDLSAPPQALKAIADAVPGARLEILTGAPHMMQIETASAYAAAIRGFLAGA